MDTNYIHSILDKAADAEDSGDFELASVYRNEALKLLWEQTD